MNLSDRKSIRKSKKLIRMSQKDQLIDREKKYLFDSMPVKRNVFKEVILLNQYKKHKKDIIFLDDSYESPRSTIWIIYKEYLDDLFSQIYRTYYEDVIPMEKDYEDGSYEIAWSIKKVSPLYEFLRERNNLKLPKYVREADNINSHKDLDTKDLNIFHEMFEKNIIEISGSYLLETIKKANYIMEIQSLLKNQEFFNEVDESIVGDGYVQITLIDTKGHLRSLLEKTGLDCQYMDRTIFVTIKTDQSYYFALTGRKIPTNIITNYISRINFISRQLLPLNITGKRKSKK